MLAFIFPGQGSQYVGMGKHLHDKYDFVREIFAVADSSLGFPLTELMFEGPAEELQKTVNAQPAILTASMVVQELLKREGIRPAAVAGHSLGEYSALVAAGSIGFSDAVRLVRLRGQFMQEAVPLGQGGMMAILGLTPEQVLEGCRRAAEYGKVEAANFNCPGQVVVAGESSALEQAQRLFKEIGARRCIPLQVSAPFHSSMMISAGKKLERELALVQVKDPEIPVVVNISADYPGNADNVREALVKQVSSPVLWEQSVNRLVGDRYTVFVEVGPGQVLTGLVKKINKDVLTLSVNGEAGTEDVLARLKEVQVGA